MSAQPTAFQRERALRTGHSFQTHRYNELNCWLCGQPARDVLHATDFLVYGEVLDGIMQHLRNQAEALDYIKMLDGSALDWVREQDGKPVRVQKEDLENYHHRDPNGLFIELGYPGDYPNLDKQIRYQIRFIDKPDRLKRHGLYLGDVLICTYSGMVDLREAKRDAVRAHNGEFPHVKAVGADEKDSE